jgi:hypothetical protein
MSDDVQPREKGAVGKFVSDVFSTEKRIGDLNGKWAVMLKLVVLFGTVIAPLLLTWAVWVTTNVYSSQYHRQSTAEFEARIAQMERQFVENKVVRDQLANIVSKLQRITPDRIEDIEEDYSELKKDVKQMTNENTAQHQNILIQLSKIQTKLEKE